MIFCLSCKKYTNDINPVGKLTKNNKPYISANYNFLQIYVIFVKNQKVNLFLLKKLKDRDFFQIYLKYPSIKFHFLNIIIIIFIFYIMRMF